MNKKDYYKVLGISKDATQQEIKRAFRKMAMKYHPDKNKDDGAEEKFKEVNEAHEILSDENKKSQYDQFGHSAFQNGGQDFNSHGFDGFEDLNDIFSSFFGGGSRRSNMPRKGGDMHAEVSITFEDSVFGKTLKEKLNKWENGHKVKKSTEIKIPAGISSGMSVLVRGFGDQGINGGQNGDLYLRVNVLSHKQYHREGNDIHIYMPVSFLEILNEDDIEVPTPYGHITISLKEGYKAGTVIRIPNKGFKSVRGNYNGDLKVHLDIYIPKMNAKEKHAVNNAVKNLKDKIKEKWMKDFK